MNSTDLPSRLLKAFAVNGVKNTIPTDSNTSTDSGGIATYDKGFPPITMQPLSSGGLPPNGKDVNGVLYSTTQQLQWGNAGMGFPFSTDFSTAINGYPKGAQLPSSVLTGQWLNLTDGNTTSPESSNGSTTGWVPINNYGVTQLTASPTSIIMSSLQAAKDRILITGTLTANINVIFPAWIKSWTVVNNCTGNFSLTCKTVSGVGVQAFPGVFTKLFCDGMDMYDESFNTGFDLTASVMPFAATTTPSGWLLCNGQNVSRNVYGRLFSRIGTTFGSGDGSTTFGLPDLRGEFLRGLDLGRGVDSGRTIGSFQDFAVQQHEHWIKTASGTSVNPVATIPDNIFISSDPNNDAGAGKGLVSTFLDGGVGNYSTETRPRNVAMAYFIKF